MTGTPNLNITELTTNQQSKVPDINNGFVKIDGATQGALAPSFTSNARTLTPTEFTSNYEMVIPALSATGTLTVPLSKRVFAVNNLGNASHDVIVKGTSGATIDIPALALVEVRNDGTGCYLYSAGAAISGVSSVNSRTGAVSLGATDLLALNSGRLIGRASAGSGASEEIHIGVGLTLDAATGTLSSTALGEALYWAGTWNANTNSPTLASGTGTPGALYTVATAGTTTIDGISSWDVGDKIAFDGVASVWRKIDGHATEVTSVAGRVGVITLTGADIGLNLGTVAYTAGDLLIANGSSYASVALSGDGTINASGTLVITKTNGAAFVASATTDTTNASNIASGTLAQARLSAQPYTLGGFVPGTLTASQVMLLHELPIAVTFPANFGASTNGGSSKSGSNANATGTATLTIDKCPAASDPTSGGNFSNVGSIVFSAGHAGTFSSSGGSTVACAAGDFLRIVAPGTADATLANVFMTLVGNR